MGKPYFRDPYGFVRDCATGERALGEISEDEIGDEQVIPVKPYLPDGAGTVSSEYDPWSKL